MSLRVTYHAIDRFQEHHPRALEDDVLQAVEAGEPLDTNLARALMSRGVNGGAPGDRYVLASDKQGILVISRDQVVVTYTRLSRSARAIMGEVEPLPPPWEPDPPPPPLPGTKKELQAEVEGMLLAFFPGCKQVCIGKSRTRQFWLDTRDRLRDQIAKGLDLRVEIGCESFRVVRHRHQVVLRPQIPCSESDPEA